MSSSDDGIHVSGCLVFEYRGRRLMAAPSSLLVEIVDPDIRKRFREIPPGVPLKYYTTEIAGFDKVRIIDSAWDKLLPLLGYVLIESEGDNPPPSDNPPPPKKSQNITHPQCVVMTFQGESVIVGKPSATGTEDPSRLLSRIAVDQFPAINLPPLKGTQNFFTKDFGLVGQQVEIASDSWKTLLPGIRSVIIDTFKRPPASPPAGTSISAFFAVALGGGDAVDEPQGITAD